MGRLRGLPDGQSASGGIVVCYTAARFEGRRVATREDGVQLGFNGSALKNLLSRLPVADLPMKDVVRLFVAVFPQDRGIWIKRAVGVHQDRQVLVFHLNQLGGV